VSSRNARFGTPEAFTRCVESLGTVRVRPEVRLSEQPAPQRIAPFSAAVAAEIIQAGIEEPLASGRFIVLHDPGGPVAWDGCWRLVTYASASVEPELGIDPLLGQVGWSWLTDALDGGGCSHRALGGTVTRVVSESYGTLDDRDASVDLELRASWTVDEPDVAEALRTWTELLCMIAGLPPLPDGVSALPGAKR